MVRNCPFCGKPVREGSRFCEACGKPLGQPASAAGHAFPEGENELSFALPGAAAGIPAAEAQGVFSVLAGGVRSLITGVPGLIRHIPALVLAVVLAVLWIVLGRQYALEENGTVSDILSWLTFARGGLTGGIGGLIGGTLGKGLVAAGACSLLYGGIPRTARGVKSLFAKKGTDIGSLLAGFGLAGLAYVFLAGHAGRFGSVAGLAGTGLTLQALAGGGFFSSLTAAVSSRRGKDGVRKVNDRKFRGLLAGAAAGFFLFALTAGVLGLTMTGWVWYLVPAAVAAAGIVLSVFGIGKTARLAVVTTVTAGMLFGVSSPARADNDGQTGYWKLEEYWEEQSDSLSYTHPGTKEELSGSAAAGFSDRVTVTVSEYRYSQTSEEDKLHKGGCSGEFGEAVVTFDPLPPSRLNPGETYDIKVNVNCSTSAHHVGVSAQTVIRYMFAPESNSYTYFRTKDKPPAVPPSEYTIRPLEVWQAEGKRSGGHNDIIGSYSATYSAEVPQGNNARYGALDNLYIRFEIYVGNIYIHSVYHYVWVDPAAAGESAGPTAVPTDNTPEETDPEETKKPGRTQEADEDEDDEPYSQTERRKGRKESGYDEGVPIAIRITSGLLGTLAGAAAAGAAAAGASGKKEAAEEERKQYRMFIRKHFSDNRLPKGADRPDWYWLEACIAEGTKDNYGRLDPASVNREMTSKIRIGTDSPGIRLTERTGANGFPAVSIAVDKDAQAGPFTLSFRYVGPGGVFTEIVTFYVAGDPYFRMKQYWEDAWLRHGRMSLPVVLGDEEQYAYFQICDFGGEPARPGIYCTGNDLVCSCERFRDKSVPEEALVYRVKISRSDVSRKPVLVGNDWPKQSTIDIRTEAGQALIFAEIWPEGITVAGTAIEKVNDFAPGRMRIDVCRGRGGELTGTEFGVTLACVDKSGAVPRIIVKKGAEAGIRFEALAGTEKYGHLLTDNFPYEIRYPEKAEEMFAFLPRSPLPMMEDPYEAVLPVIAEAGGRTFRTEVPLRITGDQPYAPEGWQAEVDKLKKTVAWFGLGNAPWSKEFIANIRHRTPNEISMARYRIIQEAVEYYSREKVEMDELGKKLDRCIMALEIAKWMGDQAFSYLVTVYAGGPFADGVLSPLKGLFEEYMSTYAGALMSGDPVDDPDNAEGVTAGSFWSHVANGVENTMWNILTGKEPPNPKKAGFIVAAFVMVSFSRHYYTGEEEKGDIFKSLLAAVGDLGGNYLKQFAGDRFKAYIRNKEGLGRTLGDWLRTIQLNDALTALDPYDPKLQETVVRTVPAEAAQKYFEETVGLAGAVVYEWATGPGGSAGIPAGTGGIALEYGGHLVEIPVEGNEERLSELFYENGLSVFDRTAKKVPVQDYVKNKKTS